MLKSLEGLTHIGGLPIVVMDELREKFPEKFTESGQMDWKWFETEIRPNFFIYVRHDKNSLSFTIQDGPVKEVGVNGCQVDHLIWGALAMINGLNAQFPSEFNAKAMDHLRSALCELQNRKKDREARGVEGLSKA